MLPLGRAEEASFSKIVAIELLRICASASENPVNFTITIKFDNLVDLIVLFAVCRVKGLLRRKAFLKSKEYLFHNPLDTPCILFRIISCLIRSLKRPVLFPEPF